VKFYILGVGGWGEITKICWHVSEFWAGTFLEESNDSELVKKFSAFCAAWDPITIQMNSVRTFTHVFFKIRIIIIIIIIY
jgi:hypothetical protein